MSAMCERCGLEALPSHVAPHLWLNNHPRDGTTKPLWRAGRCATSDPFSGISKISALTMLHHARGEAGAEQAMWEQRRIDSRLPHASDRSGRGAQMPQRRLPAT